MILERLRLDIHVKDDEFDSMYPEKIRKIGRLQWTPVAVAKMAAQYLANEPGTRVLDIGSGVGKFCMIGASFTEGLFTGVEQRPQLVKLSNQLKERYNIERVNYVNANIMDVPFNEYQAFYFFNSFYENIDSGALIDTTIERGINYYNLYTRYVQGQLEKMPVGTRLVTYWSQLQEVSSSYQLQFSALGNDLKFFKKVK